MRTAKKIRFTFSPYNGFSADVEEFEILDESLLSKCPLVTIKEQPFFDDTGLGVNKILGVKGLERIHKSKNVVKNGAYVFEYYTIEDTDEERSEIQELTKSIINTDFLRLKRICFKCNINDDLCQE